MTVAQGNFGLPITLSFVDRHRNPIDLTGKTVTLRLKIDAGSVVDKPMTVLLPETLGMAEYVFVTGDLDTAGTLQYEAVIEEPGVRLTTDKAREEEIRAVLA